MLTPEETIVGNGRATIQIHNSSVIDYHLALNPNVDYITVPGSLTLYAGKTVRLGIRKKAPQAAAGQTAKEVTGRKKISIPVTVTNLYAAPNTGMEDEISFNVRFEPKGD